jgi:hypothetical protein
MVYMGRFPSARPWEGRNPAGRAVFTKAKFETKFNGKVLREEFLFARREAFGHYAQPI